MMNEDEFRILIDNIIDLDEQVIKLGKDINIILGGADKRVTVHKVNISNDKTEEGKKKFTNDTARSIELNRRLEEDQEYQKQMGLIDTLKSQMEEKTLDCKRKKYLFRMYEILSRQVGGD